MIDYVKLSQVRVCYVRSRLCYVMLIMEVMLGYVRLG